MPGGPAPSSVAVGFDWLMVSMTTSRKLRGEEEDAELLVGKVWGHCLGNASMLGTLGDGAAFLGGPVERTLGFMVKMDLGNDGDSVPWLWIEGYEGTALTVELKARLPPA